ncbi:hypothetical protein [Maribacter sp. 2307UL18-2]|uniref:hypothetical protein n=1 Tax=Maribacter sp. 2307UL18-2 TaxID=3386274 RepID=UPI0039BD773B
MKNILPLLFLIVFGACGKSDNPLQTEPISAAAETIPGVLLFSSGFESDTYLSEPQEGFESDFWPDYEIIRGKDLTTGYSWPIRILGSNFSGIHKIDDDGGSAIDNSIDTVIGHDGQETKALFQRVNYDVLATQTPYQINNIAENPEELYISYRMKTDDSALVGPDKWRAIWEYKTDNYGTSMNGFRMIAFMETNAQGIKHWVFQGDTSPTTPIWQIENYDIPVPTNEWFQVAYYIKWSDSSDGYASMKVNGELIAEHSGATTTNSDNLDFIILTQVYGNSHPMHQWVDDIEIWNGLPE